MPLDEIAVKKSGMKISCKIHAISLVFHVINVQVEALEYRQNAGTESRKPNFLNFTAKVC